MRHGNIIKIFSYIWFFLGAYAYPPNITLPKHVFNIKNSTAIVKCFLIGQPGLIIQWVYKNKNIVDNEYYAILTNNSLTDVNGTYTSELKIKPLVHINVDNDDTYCFGDTKNVSCFFYYSIMTGYAWTNLFQANTTVIYYGFDAEFNLPILTINVTNITINIKWTTENINRDFQVFYNILLIEKNYSSNITLDNRTSIENVIIYNSTPYTLYTFQLTAFNRLGIYKKVLTSFYTQEVSETTPTKANIKIGGTSIVVIGTVVVTTICAVILLIVIGISVIRTRKRDLVKVKRNKIKKREDRIQLVPLQPVSVFKSPSFVIVDKNLDKVQFLENGQSPAAVYEDISYDDLNEAKRTVFSNDICNDYDDVNESTRAVLNKHIYSYDDLNEATKAVLSTKIVVIEKAVHKFKAKMETVLGNILHRRQPWFHGAIPRVEAERRLKSVIKTGMFLIRERGSPCGSYVVGLCYQGDVYHYLFESNDQGQLCSDSGPCFDNVMAVVSFYSQNSEGLFCTLKTACKISWFEFQPKSELYKNILLHPEIQAELKKTLLLCEDEHKTNSGISEVVSPPLDQSRPISSIPNQLDMKETWMYENIYDRKSIVGTEGFRNPFQTQERETELDPSRLQLEHKLGHGNFGSVVKGVYILKNNKSIAVAVKKLKEEDIPGQKYEIVKEADIMAQLDHPNIVRLIGIIQSPEFMLVMELAPQGPLHKFLKKKKNMNVLDILVLMLQVDEGMNYLESQYFVHRDLAARNVLVVSENFVKISDFGMSRAMGVGNEYYRAERAGKWPLKWYAPECIYYHKFSSKGDVWSYGITMWEAVSYGSVPYQGMKGPQVVEKLESGYRLPRPDNCPDAVYKMMLNCWETRPDDRPSFMEISMILSKYIFKMRELKK